MSWSQSFVLVWVYRVQQMVCLPIQANMGVEDWERPFLVVAGCPSLDAGQDFMGKAVLGCSLAWNMA